MYEAEGEYLQTRLYRPIEGRDTSDDDGDSNECDGGDAVADDETLSGVEDNGNIDPLEVYGCVEYETEFGMNIVTINTSYQLASDVVMERIVLPRFYPGWNIVDDGTRQIVPYQPLQVSMPFLELLRGQKKRGSPDPPSLRAMKKPRLNPAGIAVPVRTTATVRDNGPNVTRTGSTDSDDFAELTDMAVTPSKWGSPRKRAIKPGPLTRNRRAVSHPNNYDPDTVDDSNLYALDAIPSVPLEWRTADQDNGFPWIKYAGSFIAHLNGLNITTISQGTAQRDRMKEVAIGRLAKYKDVDSGDVADIIFDLNHYYLLAWAVNRKKGFTATNEAAALSAALNAKKMWDKYVTFPNANPKLDTWILAREENKEIEPYNVTGDTFAEVIATQRTVTRYPPKGKRVDRVWDVAPEGSPLVRFSARWLFEVYSLSYSMLDATNVRVVAPHRAKYYFALSVCLHMCMIINGVRMDGKGCPTDDYISGMARDSLQVKGYGELKFKPSKPRGSA